MNSGINHKITTCKYVACSVKSYLMRLNKICSQYFFLLTHLQ